jgi:hypothetical protein
MSYATVQTQALSILQGLAQFDTNNSAESDFRLLTHGKAAYAVMLKGATGKPGSSGQIDTVGGNDYTYWRRDDYTVELSIFAHFAIDQLATRAALTALADAVEGHFDKYPNLDSFVGIIDARIDVVGEPDEWTVGAGSYWRQIINIEVVELSKVYLSENVVQPIFRWDGTQAWDGTGQWA